MEVIFKFTLCNQFFPCRVRAFLILRFWKFYFLDFGFMEIAVFGLFMLRIKTKRKFSVVEFG